MLDSRPIPRVVALLATVTACALSVPAASAQSAGPAPAAALVAGATRELPADFFGLNGARIISPENAAQWHDPVFRQALAGVGAGLIRVQGGTTSQWIDWRTGLFDERDGSQFAGRNAGRAPLLLTDWADIVAQTGATPIFDLNVLTSTVDEQIAMLHEARRLGMTVRFVELGNELWDPGPYYKQVYPTGADYARAMNGWITALRGEFPDIEIAVSGADDSSAVTAILGDRLQTWNAGLYANIRGADAVAIHPYWVPDPIQADVASTAAGGLAAWAAFTTRVLPAVPAEMDVWITEYNQINLPLSEIPGFPQELVHGVPQTWAVGLGVAGFALASMQEPRVTMSVVHAALDGLPAAANRAANGNEEIHAVLADGSGNSVEFGRTAIHEALTPIHERARGGGPVRGLRTESVPEPTAVLASPAGVTRTPAVVGTEFVGERPGAFLLNLSDRPVPVALPAPLATATADTVSAPPLSNPAFTPSDTLTRTTADVTGEAVLPPYSLTELSAR
ncbi:hypothetical protein [Rhodococcus sp. NPDC003348]